MRFGVWGLGFGIWGLGFGVGFRVSYSHFVGVSQPPEPIRLLGVGFRFQGFGFDDWV